MQSQLNDTFQLVSRIYLDACDECAVQASARDLKTIRSRMEHEGISFVTITLPRFCADFEKCLAQSSVDPTLFRSFKKNGRIPAFLQGILGHMFDLETGRLLNDLHHSPTHYARLVAGVRQICLSYKKIRLACTPERESAAMDGFKRNESSLKEFMLPLVSENEFSRVSAALWDNLWTDFSLDDVIPKHGPGNVAERLLGNEKYSWRRWHGRLEPYFPLLECAYSPTLGEMCTAAEELKNVEVISESEEDPVRVTPVPKTLKGPRIIAIEPACMQYSQQGLKAYLYEKLESHARTAGHVNFSDQSINQALAVSASADGQWMTIDLSDASDRVPHGLALEMFRACPDLKDAIEACRSKQAKMPDGTLVPLSKFASMGSALCFPVEAMYFYTICVIALLRDDGLSVSQENIDLVSSGIYVYGDDIVVPRYAAASVLAALREYNCRVNDDKTFSSGNFRESCGVDAFLGRRVQPVYLREQPPEDRGQSNSILSCVATANQFLLRGYRRASEFLFRKVEVLTGALPPIYEWSDGIGRISPWFPHSLKKRWNSKYQRLEVRMLVPRPVYRTDILDGFGALQKCLLRLSMKKSNGTSWFRSVDDYLASIVDVDLRHLERSPLFGRVTLKRRWVPASNIAGV